MFCVHRTCYFSWKVSKMKKNSQYILPQQNISLVLSRYSVMLQRCKPILIPRKCLDHSKVGGFQWKQNNIEYFQMWRFSCNGKYCYIANIKTVAKPSLYIAPPLSKSLYTWYGVSELNPLQLYIQHGFQCKCTVEMVCTVTSKRVRNDFMCGLIK